MSQKQGYAPYLNVFLLLFKNERYICSPSPAIKHTSFAISLSQHPKVSQTKTLVYEQKVPGVYTSGVGDGVRIAVAMVALITEVERQKSLDLSHSLNTLR